MPEKKISKTKKLRANPKSLLDEKDVITKLSLIVSSWVP